MYNIFFRILLKFYTIILNQRRGLSVDFYKINNLKKVLNNLYEGAYVVDKSRKIIFWNKAAEEISGFKKEEVIGSACSDNILQHVDEEGNSLCKNGCPLTNVIEEGGVKEMEVFLKHKKGHRVPVFAKTITLLDEDNYVIGALETFTENAIHNYIFNKVKTLEKLAMIDSLTQVPNRRFLENSLRLKFDEALLTGMNLGIIFIDIDYFKKFNDDYGHDIGDLVLINVSKTLSRNLRDNDIIGRWGGEEFLGIFFGIDKEGLKRVADKLRALTEKTYTQIDGNNVNVTISIGASILKSGDTIDTLIKRADNRLYQSKKNGRNRVTID